MGRRRDVDEQYWRDYDGLQDVKHRILASYLDAWFPILSSFRGQLLYLDCHAGRGRHATGDPGSPILVLEKLRGHQLRRQILQRVKIACHFFELSQENAGRLEREIAALGPLHPRIRPHVHPTDYEASLSGALDQLERSGMNLPPSFAFIDPYGFKLSMQFMNRVLRAGRTETLINFMYRYVDMALHRPEKADILHNLFGTSKWRQLPSIRDHEARFRATVKLFSDQLEAEHVSWVVMRGSAHTIKYVLVHATNSLRGRQVMKQTMWRVLPDGSFTAYERDRPEQGVLISATERPDREVAVLLEQQFGGRSVQLVEDIYPVVDASPYRRVHVHAVLRRAIQRGTVGNVDQPGGFTISGNPRLEIPETLADSLEDQPDGGQEDLFSSL